MLQELTVVGGTQTKTLTGNVSTSDFYTHTCIMNSAVKTQGTFGASGWGAKASADLVVTRGEYFVVYLFE